MMPQRPFGVSSDTFSFLAVHSAVPRQDEKVQLIHRNIGTC
jgi:hypothetical protein